MSISETPGLAGSAPSEPLWVRTHKGDVRCRLLADDHYTRQTPGHPMWTRPGYNFVLYHETATGAAAWCWWRPKWEDGRPGTQRKDGLRAIECTLFRNHRSGTLSSVLVATAVEALTWAAAAEDLALPDPRSMLLISGVSSGKTAARRSKLKLPGACFREAGWVDMAHRPGRADVWLQVPMQLEAA